jgi:magnesium chelatase family protein
VGGGGNPQPAKFHWHTMAFYSWMNCLNLKEQVLEVMRQPMEERKVTISRAKDCPGFSGKFYVDCQYEPLSMRLFQSPRKRMQLSARCCTEIFK